MTTVTIPAPVGEILKTLEAAGYGAWCVGGCVRDALLDRMPGDWDVTTSARPEETMALFAGRAVPTGLRHGTVTVKTEQGGVEITTLRRDGAYRDHRRPETVTFTDSLEEDLRRRDFTINAMAADLQGTLYDPLGGRADLTAKVLRCVGEPDRRFGEDALRILRGLRFAAELGVTVHPDTAVAIHRNRELLRAIAPERIWAELKKLVSGKWAAEVLRAYPDVAGVFWPEILPMVGFDQRNGHHCYDVWEHTLHAMEKVKPEPELRLTMLLHDIGKASMRTTDANGVDHFKGHGPAGKEIAKKILRRLKFDNDTIAQVTHLIYWHDYRPAPEEKAVRRAIHKVGEDLFPLFLKVQRADNLAQSMYLREEKLARIDGVEKLYHEIMEKHQCVSLKTLAVTGRDLIAEGMKPGPQMGAVLQELLEVVLDQPEMNEKEKLLAWWKEHGTCQKAEGTL